MKTDFIFDLHLDLQVYLKNSKFIGMEFKDIKRYDELRHGDIYQFKYANLKFAVTNIFPFKYTKTKNSWEAINFTRFKEYLSDYIFFLNKHKIFKIILSSKDMDDLLNSNNIGIILGVEGINFLKNPQDVYYLYEKGIRVIGLNWNIDSSFSTSLKTQKAIGLTDKGFRLLEILEKLPMILDLAHSSQYTVKDVYKNYSKGFILSHNGVKEFVNFEQNVDRRILKILDNKKCLLGITLLPYSLGSLHKKVSISDWITQVKYVFKKYPNIVAIGSDFFGFKYDNFVEGAKNYKEFADSLIKYRISKKVKYKNAFKFFRSYLKD